MEEQLLLQHVLVRLLQRAELPEHDAEPEHVRLLRRRRAAHDLRRHPSNSASASERRRRGHGRAAGLADAALALRLNEALGIDARVFAGVDQFAYWFGYQCKLLPIYALATRICPPGVEATMIAMVLSLKNLGETVATYYGAIEAGSSSTPVSSNAGGFV